MFPRWRSKRAEELIFQHFSKVKETLLKSQEALLAYLQGDLQQAETLAQEASYLEGRADDIRREVEAQLLGGAFLTYSRQDLWTIIERVDKLADVGEAMLYFLLLQRVEVPKELKPLIEEILEKSFTIVAELEEALHQLFHDIERVPEHTQRVERLEHEIDEIERRAIKQLFELPLELAHKTLVRDFIAILTDISDQGEDVSDLLELAVARRRI